MAREGLEQKLVTGYIIGFIDAEGSFSVSIKVQRDLTYGVRLDPVFSITQARREVLELIRRAIGAGRILRKPGQRHLYIYIVDNMNELIEKLIPFLDKYQNLLHVKKETYLIFRDIVLTLHKGLHKNVSKLRELISKAYTLSNLSPKAHRKRSIDEIFKIINTYIAKRRDLPGER